MATCPLLFDVRFIGRTTDVEMDTSFRGMSPHFDRNITMIDNRLGEIDGYQRCNTRFLLQQISFIFQLPFLRDKYVPLLWEILRMRI